MATHNKARILGYAITNPSIIPSPDGFDKIIMQVMTIRRGIAGNYETKFEKVLIYYDCDGDNTMSTLKSLKKLDVVDITGVLNILSINKPHQCPDCGNVDVKYQGSATFIYPLSVIKLNSFSGVPNPDELLHKHFLEISHELIILGTVVTDPELLTIGDTKCCRYKLGVDRKYFVKTQSDVAEDYPWVYSYGEQAERDAIYLKMGSVIILNGFIHINKVQVPTTCSKCGKDYSYPDTRTDLVPYSVEYLSGFLTDEDIEIQKELERRKRLR